MPVSLWDVAVSFAVGVFAALVLLLLVANVGMRVLNWYVGRMERELDAITAEQEALGADREQFGNSLEQFEAELDATKSRLYELKRLQKEVESRISEAGSEQELRDIHRRIAEEEGNVLQIIERHKQIRARHKDLLTRDAEWEQRWNALKRVFPYVRRVYRFVSFIRDGNARVRGAFGAES